VRTLTVTNRGAIAADDLPRIFQPRFTTRRGGHGMGLYLTQRICERYGWSIRVAGDAVNTAVTVSF
jgi:signal transduction histidine kinase